MSISQCRQEILERTACTIQPKNGDIVLRIEIGFPANGRTINAQELIRILFDFLPNCVYNTLFYAKLNHQKLQQIHDLAEDQAYISSRAKKTKPRSFCCKRIGSSKRIWYFTTAAERCRAFFLLLLLLKLRCLFHIALTEWGSKRNYIDCRRWISRKVNTAQRFGTRCL